MRYLPGPGAGGAGAVDSVFARAGDVVAVASDYDADQIDFTPAGDIADTDAQAAIEFAQKDARKNVISFTTNTDISGSGYDTGAFYSAKPVAEADITLTLPDSASLGKRIQVCLTLPGTITVSTLSGEPLNGGSTQIIAVAGECFTLQDDGAGNGYTLVQDSRADPSSTALAFYALDEVDGASGYFETALDINDARINAVEQLLDTVTATGADISLADFITDPGAIVGAIPAGPVEITARLIQNGGSGTAAYYVELYHRDNVGSETLLGTSDVSAIIGSAIVESIKVSIEIEETQVAVDEFLVAKYYLNKIAAGSDPVIEIYCEGANAPARGVIGIPLTSIPHNTLPGPQGGQAGEYYHLTAAQQAMVAALLAAGGYESSTWTPAAEFTTVGDLAQTVTALGTFLRIGKLIFANFDLDVTSFVYSTSTGALNIKGLPYTSSNRGSIILPGFGDFTLINGVNYTGSYYDIRPGVDASAVTFKFRKVSLTLTTAAGNQADFPSANAWRIIGTVIYEAA